MTTAGWLPCASAENRVRIEREPESLLLNAERLRGEGQRRDRKAPIPPTSALACKWGHPSPARLFPIDPGGVAALHVMHENSAATLPFLFEGTREEFHQPPSSRRLADADRLVISASSAATFMATT